MLYLPITRSWMLSRTARNIYFSCALLTVGLLGTIFATRLAMSVTGVTGLTPQARALVRALLFPETLGSAVLWISMWYFWFGFDSSNYITKALCFALLFLLAPLGTLIYYVAVYRRTLKLTDQQLSTSPATRSAEVKCS